MLVGLIRPFRALRWCIDSVPRAMPWAFVGRPVGAWVASPSTFEWGYSYSYSYSNRWDHGMDLSGVHVGSSTSTALRAEYEYERDRGHGVEGGRRCGAPADDSPQRQPRGMRFTKRGRAPNGDPVQSSGSKRRMSLNLSRSRPNDATSCPSRAARAASQASAKSTLTAAKRRRASLTTSASAVTTPEL